jgi:hypothetical protein
MADTKNTDDMTFEQFKDDQRERFRAHILAGGNVAQFWIDECAPGTGFPIDEDYGDLPP